jgi:hypothetical protein
MELWLIAASFRHKLKIVMCHHGQDRYYPFAGEALSISKAMDWGPIFKCFL